MGTPFKVAVRAEHEGTEAKGTLWAAVRVDPVGRELEGQRAPLAIALVIDTSGSMQGDPLTQVLRSCEILTDLLTERDRLAVVTFSSNAGVRCGLTITDDRGRAQIKASLVGVQADGNTNMHGGIEVAAGILMTAPAGLRRVMVVLSDGQPNVGLSSAEQLATYVRGLGLAVSSLGFGLHHDENVLKAIADAGSGRYAYIADPVVARVDMARAALAHGGVVAAGLELAIKLREGVELVRIIPASELRFGAAVKTSLGDVFVDEGRLVALELRLDLPPSARGTLAEVTVTGHAPDGTPHAATVALTVDIRRGTPSVDHAALRDIIAVQADAARLDARAQADRRAYPAAAVILRQVIARIDAVPGFVANDGSDLAELREQLVDEAAQYERTSSDAERMHQRKAQLQYKMGTPSATPQAGNVAAPVFARLVGLSGAAVGTNRVLTMEQIIGRSSSCDVPVQTDQCSRMHTRLLFTNGTFVAVDLGSTNGTSVNGQLVTSHQLRDGDVIAIGATSWRFEQPRP